MPIPTYTQVITPPLLITLLKQHAEWRAAQEPATGESAVPTPLTRWQRLNRILRPTPTIPGASAAAADRWRLDLSGRVTRLSEEKLPNDLVFDQANLKGVDFHGSTLYATSFKAAILTGTIFHQAQLEYADFTDAEGLTGEQFAGANLRGAIVPDSLTTFDDLLQKIEEISKNAGKLLLSIIVGCVYALLTNATTLDSLLLSRADAPKLPLLDFKMSLPFFFGVAPTIIFCLFVYFLMYFQRLVEMQASLPAVFPDGQTIDEKSYPWVMNELIRSFAPRLRDTAPSERRVPLSWAQRLLMMAITWVLVPFTLTLLWYRYSRRHDLSLTALHILLLASSLSLAWGSYRAAVQQFRSQGVKSTPTKNLLRRWGKSGFVRGVVVALPLAAVSLHMAFLPPLFNGYAQEPYTVGSRLHNEIYDTLWRFGGIEFVGCRDQELTTKPADWSDNETDRAKMRDKIPGIKGVDLTGENLRYAYAPYCFAVKARFWSADLTGADFQRSQLMGADFSQAKLDDIQFSNANLTDSQFNGTSLDVAILSGAKLQGADFGHASLHSTLKLGYTGVQFPLWHALSHPKSALLKRIVSRLSPGAIQDFQQIGEKIQIDPKGPPKPVPDVYLWHKILSELTLLLNDDLLSGLWTVDGKFLLSERYRADGDTSSPSVRWFQNYNALRGELGDQINPDGGDGGSFLLRSLSKGDLSTNCWTLALYPDTDLASLGLPPSHTANLNAHDLSLYHGEYSLYQASLASADLRGWVLNHTDFTQADMRGSLLRGSHAVKAVFYKADLEKADFEGANLEGSDFRGANLQGCNFKNADLRGCRFVNATDTTMINGKKITRPVPTDLTGVVFTGAIIDKKTTFPSESFPDHKAWDEKSGDAECR